MYPHPRTCLQLVARGHQLPKINKHSCEIYADEKTCCCLAGHSRTWKYPEGTPAPAPNPSLLHPHPPSSFLLPLTFFSLELFKSLSNFYTKVATSNFSLFSCLGFLVSDMVG